MIEVDKIVAEIRKAIQIARNEEDLRIRVSAVIEKEIAEKLGIPLGKYEYTFISGGRADALYGHVIIEYKAPGKLAKGIVKAKKQIVEYIKKEAKDEERYGEFLGVIFSDKIAFVRYDRRNKFWVLRGPYDINRETIIRLIEAIRGLRRKKLSVNEIIKDFGPDSDVAKHAITTFYNKLKRAQNEKVKILFEDWKRVFSQICGYTSHKLKGLEKKYGLRNTDNEALLFAIHTYYGLFMKLLAAEIAYLFSAGRFLVSYVQKIYETYIEGKNLKNILKELESGGLFKDVIGITNFVEGDYFSWYLEEFDDKIAEVVAEIARRLSDYEPATPVLEPEYTKDLLKRLYQYLVPRKIRHDLGEYYTPDWLAELVLDETGFTIEKFEKIAKETGDATAPLQLRILDPACGSGTFLVLAIKRLKEYAERHYLKDILGKYILKNVVGYDLNPLAVLAARTNYLLAIADILPSRENIEIPVYLADSLLVETKTTLMGPTYVIKTSAGTFVVPREVINKLDKLLYYIEKGVNYNYTPQEFIRYLKENGFMFSNETFSIISDLYNVFFELEKAGKNKIWASIIRNAFAPLLKGRFDYVVGNPPWINWEYLPKSYRQQTKELWEKYRLTRTTKGPGMGKVKKDMSMLFVARCLDKYTNDKGVLAFLIPFTVFKTHAGAGFRMFLAGFTNVPCKVLKIHDLVTLFPFESAENRTSLLVLEKSPKTQFPVHCITWNAQRSINQDEDLNNVKKITTQYELVFIPLKNKPMNPWMQITLPAYEGLEKMIGSNSYEAHEGVKTAFNQIYWVKVLEERDNRVLITNPCIPGQKKKIKQVVHIIEKELLYPLLRGRDVKKWHAACSGLIVIPHDPKNGKPLKEDILKIKYPHVYQYFYTFKKELENRSIHKLWGKNNPFYSLYAISNYTFAPYKVVYKAIAGKITGKFTEFAAAVVLSEDKAIIPDASLMLIPVNNMLEAHYLTAILNSTIIKTAIASYAYEIGGYTHILEYIKIPKFNPQDPLHQKLSQLSQKAHEIAKKIYEENREDLRKIEEEIDKTAAELYGITDEELLEIRKCLKILKGEI